jgi:hypothetical protein
VSPGGVVLEFRVATRIGAIMLPRVLDDDITSRHGLPVILSLLPQ